MMTTVASEANLPVKVTSVTVVSLYGEQGQNDDAGANGLVERGRQEYKEHVYKE